MTGKGPNMLLISAQGDAEPRIQISGRHDADAFVEVGSVTKTFTAALLHVLAACGQIGLDDRVSDYVDVEGGSTITLRHLAEHKSGLPRLPPGVQVWRSDPYRNIDWPSFGKIVKELTRYERSIPGENEEYSNFGYAVLGAALSSATGLPWIDALQLHVVKPLDLGEKVVTVEGVPADRKLVALDRKGKPRSTWNLGPLEPAGGLWTTSNTLATYTRKVLVDRALGSVPIGWQHVDGIDWHNGATRDAVVFVGARKDRWSVCHGFNQSPITVDQCGLQPLEEQQP